MIMPDGKMIKKRYVGGESIPWNPQSFTISTRLALHGVGKVSYPSSWFNRILFIL